ncbi:MAG: hypothetical protein ACPGNV_11295 [Mangrovicoccus sp.]
MTEKPTIHDYLILEYGTCQAKMTAAVDYLQKIELYALIGISAVYTLFFNSLEQIGFANRELIYIVWIPPLLCAIAWYRSFMQRKYIESISIYLRSVEAELSRSLPTREHAWKSVGWETWYEKDGPKTYNGFYRFVFWPMLLIATIAIAVYTGGASIGIHRF